MEPVSYVRSTDRQQVEQMRVRALGLERAVGSVLGINARRQPAAVHPDGKIRPDKRRDPRLVGGVVGGGDALAPLASSAAAEEGARVLPDPPRRARRNVAAPLAHPGQARL